MSAAEEHDPKEQPLISHLIELRNRILRSAAVVLVLFLILFGFANEIYTFVSDPLTRQLDNPLIATNPMDPFMIPMKLCFMVALFVSFPYVLHQIWAFISPGLYRHEIKVTFPILVSSVVLFYAGLAFCYYVVLGYLFNFFIQQAPDSVEVMTDMGAYYNFVMGLFLIFGLVFEIPVATVLLVISGVTNPKDLAEKRPYIIIACFVVSVPLTPQDPITLFMMAVPMCLLFELGAFASRLFYTPEPDEAQESPQPT